MVFLRNAFGQRKAIFQLHGSGCYAVGTTIFNVETNGDSIRLVYAKAEQNSNDKWEYLEYRYTDEKKLVGNMLNLSHSSDLIAKIYSVISEDPLIYKSCNKKIDINLLRKDTITIKDFYE